MQHRNGEHMEEAMAMLAKSGKTPEQLYKALCEQQVDLVFTAHPTQAMRGSVRKKYVNLFQDLRKLLHKMPNVEHHEIMEDMYANVQVSQFKYPCNSECPIMLLLLTTNNKFGAGVVGLYQYIGVCCSGVCACPLVSPEVHHRFK